MTNSEKFNFDICYTHDGSYGFDYSITRVGVLLAKGWIRCDNAVQMIQLVRDIANKATELTP